MAVHFGLAALAVPALVVAAGRLPLRAHVEQVDEEVGRQHARLVGEHAVLAAAAVGAQHAQAADQHRHLGRGQRQQLRLVDQQVLDRHAGRTLEVVAEAVGHGLEHGEGLDVGLVLRGIDAARRERHVDADARRLGRLLDADAAGQHDHVGQRELARRLLDLLPAWPAPWPARPAC